MPEITTIVTDLFENNSKGVGNFPQLQAPGPKEISEIDMCYRITRYAKPVTVSFGPAPNNSVNAEPANYPEANGFCLFFQDAWSTVATLTRDHRIVLGGNYGGCLYSVYQTSGDRFQCIHTARPLGPEIESAVQDLHNYAATQEWKLVHEVPTRGLIGVGGCDSVFIVTQVSYTIFPRPVVRTVRLQLNNQRLSIARHRWVDVAPS